MNQSVVSLHVCYDSESCVIVFPAIRRRFSATKRPMSRDALPDPRVFFQMDGRPLEDMTLSIGESVQGQLEMLPCASVQKMTALCKAFQGILKNQPVYRLRRGASVSNLLVQVSSAIRLP